MGKNKISILIIVLFFLLVAGIFLYSSTSDKIISFIPANIDYYWHLDVSLWHRSGLSFLNWLNNNKEEKISQVDYWQKTVDNHFPDSKINWQQEVNPYLTGEMAGFKLSGQSKESSPTFVFKLKKPLLLEKPNFFYFDDFLILTNQTTTTYLLDKQIDDKLINQIKQKNFWERIVDNSFLKVYFQPGQFFSIAELSNYWAEINFRATKDEINFYSFPKTRLFKNKLNIFRNEYTNYPTAFLSLYLSPHVIDSQWLLSGGQLLLFYDEEKTNKDYLLILPAPTLNRQQLENRLIKQLASLFPITKTRILPDQSTVQELIVDQSAWKFTDYPSVDYMFRLIDLSDHQQLIYCLQDENLLLSNSIDVLHNSLSIDQDRVVQRERMIPALSRSFSVNEQLILSSLDKIKQFGIKQIILQSFDLKTLSITGILK